MGETGWPSSSVCGGLPTSRWADEIRVESIGFRNCKKSSTGETLVKESLAESQCIVAPVVILEASPLTRRQAVLSVVVVNVDLVLHLATVITIPQSTNSTWRRVR